jgi:hypothetical protein
MADPLALINAIDALIQFVDAGRHASFQASLIGPKGIRRLEELDLIIGSECQQLGISIPHLDQRLGEFTILFGFTRLPCTPGVRGVTRPQPSRNWRQSLAIVRRIASELAAKVDDPEVSDLMTVFQIAHIVGRRPNTLRNKGVLGTPARQGGGRSKPSLWHYLVVKPAIESAFGFPLPGLAEAKNIISRAD